MSSEIRIENREDLIFLLSEAAELEHGLLCSYLFAAYSLKSRPDEGLTAAQLTAARHWKATLTEIAVGEMLHLSLVSNLLTAIGAAPHLRRPNFPQRSSYYPPTFLLALTPFSEETIEHFIFMERPEDVELENPLLPPDADDEQRATTTSAIVAEAQDYATVGQLYRAIQDGVHQLADRLGPTRLFVGPARAQATTALFRFAGLVPVTDLASAVAAIERIIVDGEGPYGGGEDAHYGRLRRIHREFLALREQASDFQPARPVLANPFARRPADAADVNLLDDPETVVVADLCNGAYALMMQLLGRFFTHVEETDAELRTLVQATITLMTGVLTPLGELLTTLPAGPSHPGLHAGPSFEFYRSLTMPPHRQAAWVLFQERAVELAQFCDRLPDEPRAAAVLAEVKARLLGVAEALQLSVSSDTATEIVDQPKDRPEMGEAAGSQDPAVATLAPGMGVIIERHGSPVAVHRDGQGVVHALSAVFTHLGCTVGWNVTDQTWNCPCHGSIFSATGTVLYGPAAKNLEPVDISGASDGR